MKIIVFLRDFFLTHRKIKYWLLVVLFIGYLVLRFKYDFDSEGLLILIWGLWMTIPLLFALMGIEFNNKIAVFRPGRKWSRWVDVSLFLFLFALGLASILPFLSVDAPGSLINYLIIIAFTALIAYLVLVRRNINLRVSPSYFKIIFTQNELLFYTLHNEVIDTIALKTDSTKFEFSKPDHVYLTDYSKADHTPLHISLSEIHPDERSSFLKHLKELVKTA